MISKLKIRNYRKLSEILYLCSATELAKDENDVIEQSELNHLKSIQPKEEVNLKGRLEIFSQIQTKLNSNENE